MDESRKAVQIYGNQPGNRLPLSHFCTNMQRYPALTEVHFYSFNFTPTASSLLGKIDKLKILKLFWCDIAHLGKKIARSVAEQLEELMISGGSPDPQHMGDLAELQWSKLVCLHLPGIWSSRPYGVREHERLAMGKAVAELLNQCPNSETFSSSDSKAGQGINEGIDECIGFGQK